MPRIPLFRVISRLAKSGVEAAYSAARTADAHVRSEFFEKDGDKLVPKSNEVVVDGRDIQVPLLTQSKTPSMEVTTVELVFDTSVGFAEDGDAYIHGHVGLLKKSVAVGVKISIAATPTPEGLELIREKLNQNLSHELGGSHAQRHTDSN